MRHKASFRCFSRHLRSGQSNSSLYRIRHQVFHLNVPFSCSVSMFWLRLLRLLVPQVLVWLPQTRCEWPRIVKLLMPHFPSLINSYNSGIFESCQKFAHCGTQLSRVSCSHKLHLKRNIQSVARQGAAFWCAYMKQGEYGLYYSNSERYVG